MIVKEALFGFFWLDIMISQMLDVAVLSFLVIPFKPIPAEFSHDCSSVKSLRDSFSSPDNSLPRLSYGDGLQFGFIRNHVIGVFVKCTV